MAAKKRTECAEEERHRARQSAEAEVETWVLGYAHDNGLSDLDLLRVLGYVTQTVLRYADRDDEERRTGFRHRMAGE